MRAPVSPDSRRALAAMAAASLVSGAANLTLPIWLGAVVQQLGARERDVALVGSAELGCLAITALTLAPRLAAVSRRALALAGALLLVAGNAAAAGAAPGRSLFRAGVLSGKGAGGAGGPLNATAAAASVPERTYALVFVLGGAACALLMVAMPPCADAWGTAGAFGVLLAATLAASPLLLWMPPHPAPAAAAEPPGRFPRAPAVLAALAASLAVTIGVDSLWPFAERIGRRTGLGSTPIGVVLAVTSLAVLVAAGFASWLGVRRGRVAPLATGFVVFAAAAVALAYAGSPFVFVPAVVLLGAGFYFAQPFLMGTLAALDPYGRVTAAGGAVMTVGAALGPGIGGLLVSDGDYALTGWFAAASGIAALAVFAAIAARVERAEEIERLGSDSP